MAKQKVFNITGPCIPAVHYMVDTGKKIDEIIRDYIEAGEYFTINRARQYGKTTTLGLIENAIQSDFIAIRISFEGFGSAVFSSESDFIATFISRCSRSLQRSNLEASVIGDWRKDSDGLNLPKLEDKIISLIQAANRRIVIMIDEVDKSSNNQLFLDFLGMLRNMYIEREQYQTPAFHSVILAGVHDIKNLKMKLRPEERHSYNSPWNIATNFDVDMSFSAPEIASMLDEYERDYHTGMDIARVSRRLYYYTSGYPFLVSLLCKTIADGGLKWTEGGVDEAENLSVKSSNTLFDDVTKNLVNNPNFSDLVRRILLQGAHIAFEDQNPVINTGLMYGIFSKDGNGLIKVSNVIFETRIYNYFVSVETTSMSFNNIAAEKGLFIQDGHLDMDTVLKRFSMLMYSEYHDENSEFLERHAGLLFLCYIKPIINGIGHYVVEPETRGGRRMDIIVFYGTDEHIIELKIWRGEKYEERGIDQLAHYLSYRGQKRGYLLSFCDNKTSPREGKTFTHDGCEITEVIVAYRDKE